MRRAGFAPEPLGKDKAKAIARCEDVNAAWDNIRAGKDVKTEPRPDTFGALVEQLRRGADFRDKAPATRTQFDYAMDKYVLPIFGPTALIQIEPGDVQLFYDHLRATGGVTRAKTVMKWLRYVLNTAHRLGKLERSPGSAVRVRQPRPRRQIWTPEQVAAVVAEAGRQRLSGIAAVILVGARQESNLRPSA